MERRQPTDGTLTEYIAERGEGWPILLRALADDVEQRGEGCNVVAINCEVADGLMLIAVVVEG